MYLFTVPIGNSSSRSDDFVCGVMQKVIYFILEFEKEGKSKVAYFEESTISASWASGRGLKIPDYL